MQAKNNNKKDDYYYNNNNNNNDDIYKSKQLHTVSYRVFRELFLVNGKSCVQIAASEE